MTRSTICRCPSIVALIKVVCAIYGDTLLNGRYRCRYELEKFGILKVLASRVGPYMYLQYMWLILNCRHGPLVDRNPDDQDTQYNHIQGQCMNLAPMVKVWPQIFHSSYRYNLRICSTIKMAKWLPVYVHCSWRPYKVPRYGTHIAQDFQALIFKLMASNGWWRHGWNGRP